MKCPLVVDEVESQTNGIKHDIVVDSYYKMTHNENLKKIPGQANHTLQLTVYKNIVPKGRSSSVKLIGDVFKTPEASITNFMNLLKNGGINIEKKVISIGKCQLILNI